MLHRQFAQRLRKLKLAPQHSGILRILDSTPGITQQTLAAALGWLRADWLFSLMKWNSEE